METFKPARLLTKNGDSLDLDNITASKTNLVISSTIHVLTKIKENETYMLKTGMGTTWREGVHVKLGVPRKEDIGYVFPFSVIPSDS